MRYIISLDNILINFNIINLKLPTVKHCNEIAEPGYAVQMES